MMSAMQWGCTRWEFAALWHEKVLLTPVFALFSFFPPPLSSFYKRPKQCIFMKYHELNLNFSDRVRRILTLNS